MNHETIMHSLNKEINKYYYDVINSDNPSIAPIKNQLKQMSDPAKDPDSFKDVLNIIIQNQKLYPTPKINRLLVYFKTGEDSVVQLQQLINLYLDRVISDYDAKTNADALPHKKISVDGKFGPETLRGYNFVVGDMNSRIESLIEGADPETKKSYSDNLLSPFTGVTARKITPEQRISMLHNVDKAISFFNKQEVKDNDYFTSEQKQNVHDEAFLRYFAASNNGEVMDFGKQNIEYIYNLSSNPANAREILNAFGYNYKEAKPNYVMFNRIISYFYFARLIMILYNSNNPREIFQYIAPNKIVTSDPFAFMPKYVNNLIVKRLRLKYRAAVNDEELVRLANKAENKKYTLQDIRDERQWFSLFTKYNG